MWVFVDVDGTLIDKDDVPRPYIVEFFSRLRVLGCTVVVWSAGGAGYAENKLNMIANKLNWQGLMDIRPLVHTYLWKDDWTNAVKKIKGKQFYVDDESSLLEVASDLGHGTFKVPFYSTLTNDDNWLLRALTVIERVVDEEVYRSSDSDDGDQSQESQEGVAESAGGSSDEDSDAAARDRLRRISEGLL